MNITVESHINIPKDLAKVDNDRFWKYAANEWWRLITPYTPMETGTMSEQVKITPKQIEYTSPYAHFLYNGMLMVSPTTHSSYAKKGERKVLTDQKLKLDKTKHPLASKEWDKAAKPTKAPKLINALQMFVDMGRLHLDG